MIVEVFGLQLTQYVRWFPSIVSVLEDQHGQTEFLPHVPTREPGYHSRE